MKHKLYTRELRVPRRNKPITVKELHRYIKQDLTAGEELVQINLLTVEATHFVYEMGIQKRNS